MGLVRNLKIKALASQATSKMMAAASRMRCEEPDEGLGAMECLELIGDQLAIMARDNGLDERERLCVVQGLRHALEGERLSHTARENIIALLTPRIMAATPVSQVADELRDLGIISTTTASALTKGSGLFGFLKPRRDRLALGIIQNMISLEKCAQAGAWEEASVFAARQDPLLATYLQCAGASDEHLDNALRSHRPLIRSIHDEEYMEWICDELLKRGLQPL